MNKLNFINGQMNEETRFCSFDKIYYIYLYPMAPIIHFIHWIAINFEELNETFIEIHADN